MTAVDLQAMAVARHIPLDGPPSEVIAAGTRPSVYALTPTTGTVHEIEADHLKFARKLTVSPGALSMRMAREERVLYVLSREPRALYRVALDSLRPEWHMPLPEEPKEFTLSADGKTAAVSLSIGVS